MRSRANSFARRFWMTVGLLEAISLITRLATGSLAFPWFDLVLVAMVFLGFVLDDEPKWTRDQPTIIGRDPEP